MTDSTDKTVERWKPEQFKDKVESKIRESFIDLIPEDAFKKMVSDAIDKFTTGETKRVSDYGGSKEVYVNSGIENVVDQILRDEVKAALKAMLCSEEWVRDYNGVMGKHLAKLVADAAPQMIQQLMSSMIENALQQVRFIG